MNYRYLDNWITGHWGEDQFGNEEPDPPEGSPAEIMAAKFLTVRLDMERYLHLVDSPWTRTEHWNQFRTDFPQDIWEEAQRLVNKFFMDTDGELLT